MRVLIIGGGIGGLTTALSLHAAGIDCLVAESALELRPLGVGINLQPHAVRELIELGLGDELAKIGVPTSYQTYTDRFGGTILALPRGRFAGYNWPQYSIHRGELQMLLLFAVRERLGSGAVRTGLSLEDFEQHSPRLPGTRGFTGVTASLRDVRTGELLKETADVLVGADGIHSTVRARLHPDDGPLMWNGIRMWRGTAEGDPFLDGTTLIVAGAMAVSKFVVYPISAPVRGESTDQLGGRGGDRRTRPPCGRRLVETRPTGGRAPAFRRLAAALSGRAGAYFRFGADPGISHGGQGSAALVGDGQGHLCWVMPLTRCIRWAATAARRPYWTPASWPGNWPVRPTRPRDWPRTNRTAGPPPPNSCSPIVSCP